MRHCNKIPPVTKEKSCGSHEVENALSPRVGRLNPHGENSDSIWYLNCKGLSRRGVGRVQRLNFTLRITLSLKRLV